MNSRLEFSEQFEEMRFEINRKKLIELAKFRGWITKTSDKDFCELPRGLITRFANELGFTVSYCRRVILGHEKLHTSFMLQYIKIAGVKFENPLEWGSLFIANIKGKFPAIHDPQNNLVKMRGQGVKYRWSSPAYDIRKMDDPKVEMETLSESMKVKGRPTPPRRGRYTKS